MYPYDLFSPKPRRKKNFHRPLSLEELIEARDGLNKFIESEIEKKEKGKKDKDKPKAPAFNLLETMALVFMATWAQSFIIPYLTK